MTNIAFVFPGQGSQKIGMGSELCSTFSEARDIFCQTDDALGRSLSRLMFEGPQEELNLAENARPALIATGLAVMSVLEKQGDLPLATTARFVAGHSLGEYTALCAAGSVPLDYTVRLVDRTAKMMQEAMPVGSTAMAALGSKNGFDLSTVHELTRWAAQGEVCALAAHNAPGQVVIAGHASAVGRAVERAETQLGWAAKRLGITIPAHSPLMAFIESYVRDDLEGAGLKNPTVPFISNATAQPETDAGVIRDLLVFQLTRPVRWYESVLRMKNEGIEALIECGSGQVLARLTGSIDEKLTVKSLRTPRDIEDFIAHYREGRYVSPRANRENTAYAAN